MAVSAVNFNGKLFLTFTFAVYNIAMEQASGKNGQAVRIMEDLMQEEGAENALIALYGFMLDIGIHFCFPPEHRLKLREGMQILHDDSLEHKKIVEMMLIKYKK